MGSDTIFFFCYCILFFIISSILILRNIRLIQILQNEDVTMFNGMLNIFNLKNVKIDKILTFCAIPPFAILLYLIQKREIKAIFTFILNPKIALYFLIFSYIIQALILIIFIFEDKLAKKYTSKNKLQAIYFNLIISFSFIFIGFYFMPTF